MDSARIHAKHCIRIEHFNQIASCISSAMRNALYGKPGAVYLEIPVRKLKKEKRNREKEKKK